MHERDVGNIEERERKGKREKKRGTKEERRFRGRFKGAEIVPIGRLSCTFASVQTPTSNNYLDPYIYLHVITLHPRLASSSRDLINM